MVSAPPKETEHGTRTNNSTPPPEAPSGFPFGFPTIFHIEPARAPGWHQSDGLVPMAPQLLHRLAPPMPRRPDAGVLFSVFFWMFFMALWWTQHIPGLSGAFCWPGEPETKKLFDSMLPPWSQLCTLWIKIQHKVKMCFARPLISQYSKILRQY